MTATQSQIRDALKTCYCHTCASDFHPLEIMRHREMHRDKKEDCKITFSKGHTSEYFYSNRKRLKDHDI